MFFLLDTYDRCTRRKAIFPFNSTRSKPHASVPINPNIFFIHSIMLALSMILSLHSVGLTLRCVCRERGSSSRMIHTKTYILSFIYTYLLLDNVNFTFFPIIPVSFSFVLFSISLPFEIFFSTFLIVSFFHRFPSFTGKKIFKRFRRYTIDTQRHFKNSKQVLLYTGKILKELKTIRDVIQRVNRRIGCQDIVK